MAAITPAVGDGPPIADANTTGLEMLKFVWLNTLKNSERNRMFHRSENENFFFRDRSVSISPGPGKTFQQALNFAYVQPVRAHDDSGRIV